MSELPAPTRAPSIAFRVSLAIGLILALVVLVTIAAAYRFGQSAANEAFDRLLKGAAFQIAERVVVIDGHPVVDVPASAFELLSLARSDRVFYRIVGPDGATLTGYDDLPSPEAGPGKEVVYDTSYVGVPVRAFMLTRQLAERSVSGELAVIVAQTTEERAALALSIATQAVVITLVVGLVLLILARGALAIALRPLARLERAILGRDSNDLSPLEVAAPTETAALVSAINRLMGRLDRRLRAMQDFVADAAHQMRTPITALSAQAQLALVEKDPVRLERLHDRIHRRSIGLARLADQLLSHALVTHRAETATAEIVDLRRVALDAEVQIRNLVDADAGGLVLDLPDDAVQVRGDRVTLREAVGNLIDNALKHGRPPARLVVGSNGSGEATIAVSDAGSGIAPELVGRIGERFATSGVGPESAGLGLSIVASVAAAHGGRLSTGRTADGRFEAALVLPRAGR